MPTAKKTPAYVEDKTYLRDKTNGRIHEYNRDLAKMPKMEAVIPNPSKKQAAKDESKKEEPPAPPKANTDNDSKGK